ncbi:hypothetical protein VQ045_20800, partial [Aurantimonas sp. E1-2-R+4]|uniref:hypothetical protein n=1 Tax=Aurantimonas sp. E1-2-R+4 TaxID=3113714 RepID=UPI002F93F811
FREPVAQRARIPQTGVYPPNAAKALFKLNNFPDRLLYLFAFSEYEGTRLASFPRYVNTFLVALWVIGPVFLALGSSTGFRRVLAIAVLAVPLYFSAPSLRLMPATFSQVSNPSFAVRAEVEELLNQTPPEVRRGAHTFVIWNGTVGEQFYMAMYGLTPAPTNRSGFSFGQPRFEGDVWSQDIPVDKFETLLENSSYVLLGRVDEEFVDRYSSLFEEHPVIGWYSLDRESEGVIMRKID